ncbi:hypothetical protein SAMD00019534_034520 [Acytostelium subglobosum LB1]|uniref:hypothetical protein n=1 Tax=Acytostelium subglobosum LB1 TaxID=1410327 RepID=UPI00064485F1|nr:hypothetical protein SAMD00019534_034520 [Acytostelium subglobosum LB1]GAM20277.1 hypothetical protein SAMD00019534_034520 [Acytostelium subglobosum LB1]|eukprot:XP_012759798.1 hypothetical protein SAMD00019534_034520 [Acytostelium subglobosum LB1]
MNNQQQQQMQQEDIDQSFKEQYKRDLLNQLLNNARGTTSSSPSSSGLQPVNSTPSTTCTMTATETIDYMNRMKTLGNQYFSKSLYSFAYSYYCLALKQSDVYLAGAPATAMTEIEEIKKLASVIACNLSLSLSKEHRIPESLTYANKSVEYDGTNGKGHYRVAYAQQLMGHDTDAFATLTNALAYANDINKLEGSLKKELKAVEQRRRKNEDNRRHTLARIKNDKQFDQFPVALVWDEQLGRKMIAKRDIAKGELVVRVAPFGSALIDETMSTHCSSCFRYVQYCKYTSCPKCKMCILCDQCDSDSVITDEHREECDVLQYLKDHGAEHGQTRDFRMMTRVLIRAVADLNKKVGKDTGLPKLWRSEPFIYDSFDDLMHLATDESAIDEEQMQAFKVSAESIITLIQYLKGPHYLLPLTKQQIMDIYPKILFNAHEYIEPLNHKEVARGIYPTAAYLNHSCDPNCIWYNDNNGMMAFRSNRLIKAGEEATTTYIDIARPSIERRVSLMKHYSFYCQCSRCDSHQLAWRCDVVGCGQPLDNSCLRIWEPQPKNNFDGLVYECANGHTRMATIYNILEQCATIPSIAIQERLINMYKSHLMDHNTLYLRIWKNLAELYFDEGNYQQTVDCIETLWKQNDAIPYVADCMALMSMALINLNAPANKLSIVKEKCREILQHQVGPGHHIMNEFEELYRVSSSTTKH